MQTFISPGKTAFVIYIPSTKSWLASGDGGITTYSDYIRIFGTLSLARATITRIENAIEKRKRYMLRQKSPDTTYLSKMEGFLNEAIIQEVRIDLTPIQNHPHKKGKP